MNLTPDCASDSLRLRARERSLARRPLQLQIGEIEMRLTIFAFSAVAFLSLAASVIAQTGKEQEPATSGTTTSSPSSATGPNPDVDGSRIGEKKLNPGEPRKYENEMSEVKERMQRIRARREGREVPEAQVNERERGEKEAAESPGAKGTPPGNHYGWEPGASASPAASASPSASAVASPSASIGLTPTPSPR
ncbi:MAG: hypothetical protein DME57_05055 [Verrucomicrobia bacterium]|nr:MAG: hypothetical protein DME57_05055 [Verrucomicrobiota bacterium]